MQNIIIAFASKLAMDLLKAGVHGLWEGFWGVVFDAVKQAEKEWIAEGQSEVKKQYVIDKVMIYVNAMKRLNFVQKWAIKTFVARVIDSIIDRLNAELGRSWVDKVEDLKKYLEDKIPYVKD